RDGPEEEPPAVSEVEPADDREPAMDAEHTDEHHPADEDDEHEHAEVPEHEHEEAPRSLAGRVLMALVILVIGGGLFLWGAPRLYPHLPAAIQRHASWMMPGEPSARQQAEALAALRKDLEAKIEDRFGAITPGMPAEEVRALVREETGKLQAATAEQIAALEKRLSDRLTALGDQVAAIDGRDLESRLARVESTLSGLSAQLDSLKKALAGVTESGGQISAETLSQLSAFSAAVDGLKGELSGLAGKLGALSQRIDEVEAASKRREAAIAEQAAANIRAAEEARRKAALRRVLAVLGERLESGTPFADVLEELDPLIEGPVPQDLAALAESGVPRRDALLAAFPELAHDAIRAAMRERSNGDVISRATSFLESRVATRSLEEKPGDSVDAILSRVEARLREDRAQAALKEAESLPDVARAPLQGWIGKLARRARAQAALASLQSAAEATN
ncbi:MAG: hypothetical protein D6754_01420, partial [Alphaproteobacteria bacterium]